MSRTWTTVDPDSGPVCILRLDLLDNPLVLHACQDGVEVSHGGEAELLPWVDVMALRDFLNVAWGERP